MTKTNFKNIGVFGGSFDPPHKGHLYISERSLKLLKLKKIIWAITKKNPFKKKTFFSLRLRKKLCLNLIKRNKKRSENNKFDKVYVKQFDRIKKNYNEIIKNKISNNFIKVNGDNSPEQIHNEILTYLKKCKLI